MNIRASEDVADMSTKSQQYIYKENPNLTYLWHQHGDWHAVKSSEQWP